MKIDRKYLKHAVKSILSGTEKDEALLIDTAGKLDTLSQLYKQSRLFRNIMLNPGLGVDHKVKALEKVTSILGIHQAVFSVLVKILKENRAEVFAELGKAFRFEVEKFFATVKGEIIAAHPVDEEFLSRVKAVVEAKLGKKVEFTVKEDPSLIAGAVIRAGSYVIDTSVRTYLKKLEQELSRF